MQSRMKLLNAVAFVAFQFAFASPASALEAQPGDACPVVGRYTFSGGPELSGVTHQMVCNASNIWSSILDNDAAGNAALAHAVSLTGDISPSQITTNQNDYSPAGLSTASVLRVNSDASRNVTSLAGGADGRIVTIMNVGSFPIVLKNDDGATGTAANRFALTGDLTLAAKQSAMLMYDSTASRWRQIANGTASGGTTAAAGSDRQIQFNNAGVLGGVPNFEFNTDGHLDYWENLTTTAGGSYAHARFHADVAPTAAQTSGRTTRGLQGAIWVSAGNTNQVRKVIGSDGFAQNLGTGAIESIMGVQGYTYNNGNAAITNMFGSYTGVESTTGTVTSMLGTDIDTLVSGGTVSNVYGLLVNNQITGGAVTNRYGIYMNPPTGSATNDWGIYQDGTQSNRFNGNIGIGKNPGAGLDVGTSVAFSGDISPAQITANQNDYNPPGLSTASVLRMSSDASRTITGLAGGVDGRVLTILNVGTNPIVLSNQDASSTTANRFAFGINVTLAADQTAAVIYDATSQRWRAAGLPFDTGTCGDSTSGFFVLTQDSWNGDLVTAAGGGMSGLDAGNALCLGDLTTYDWQCKSVAQNRGLLNSTHVKAFLCDSAGCNDATASTVYYYARSNDPNSGGNRFKTDASGRGPQEASYWDNNYNMNDTRNLWSGRNGGTMLAWPDTPNATCANWTSSSAGLNGRTGNTNNYETKRWSNGSPTCNNANRLVCFVNP